MPISVCENEEQLNHWCEQFAKKDRYVVYITTEDNELILEPIKTSRPIRYAYMKFENIEHARKVANELAQHFGLKIVEIRRMAWDIEKGPWIRIPIKKE
jgi:hypothetical protein